MVKKILTILFILSCSLLITSGSDEITERFEKYRSVNFQDVISDQYEALTKALTTKLPYEDIGRTDPLSIPLPFIDQGQAEYDQVRATRSVDQVEIEVVGVISVGYSDQVSVLIDGEKHLMLEGDKVLAFKDRPVVVKLTEASPEEVIFRLSSGRVDRIRVFINE